MQENKQESSSLDIKKLDYKDCGCPQKTFAFQPATLIKRVSPIMSPTGSEEIIPIDVYVCMKCNKIPAFIAEKIPGGIPEDLKIPI